MTLATNLFVLVTSVALFVLPRRWAPLPLLVGVCYITLDQILLIGRFHFTAIRILIAVGGLRLLCRGERPVGGFHALDGVMLLWAAWAIFSSRFHEPPVDALVFRLGLVYNSLGIYFLIRSFCADVEDISQLFQITALLLIPVAAEMVFEKISGQNLFFLLGDNLAEVMMRKGAYRAQGPFRHPILAGTVGALTLPIIIGNWQRHRLNAKFGIAACLVMVVTSNSSGPLLALLVSLLGVAFWPYRHLTKWLRLAAVGSYLALDLVMSAPAYYLIARIDLTGGSTGYHRAALITAAIRYFDDWWLAGTDYTRHWMPYGVPWSENHADITNHYLHYAVLGGLPLLLLFLLMLGTGFRYVGTALRERGDEAPEDGFLIWCLGVSLFAHAVTCVSVSYFDQSFVFLFLTLGMIGSLRATPPPATADDA